MRFSTSPSLCGGEVMRSEFIADVEQQYEMYCKIAEEHGFIDLNAKKNGFRCTTKLNEFNAGWIAFTGAIAAMREDQQSKIDELQKRVDEITNIATELAEYASYAEIVGGVTVNRSAVRSFCDKIFDFNRKVNQDLEQALKGGSDE